MASASIRFVRPVLALAVLAVPGAAMADVLQIEPGGAQWIAGGPREAAPPPVARPANSANPVPRGVPAPQVTLTSRYGRRIAPTLHVERSHYGVDLAAPVGTPVYATADGVVARAGWLGSYGNLVQLAHAGGYETRYAHLSQFAVAPGQQVRAGELIGLIGSTGRSTGPHLHYEVRINGIAVNPLGYMGVAGG